MKETIRIKKLGIVDSSRVSAIDGRIEIHIPISYVEEHLEKIFDECTADYMKKHEYIKTNEELNYSVRLIFSCGGFNSDNKSEIEFKLLIIIWQISDDETGKDTAEFYDDIQITFDKEELKIVKKMVIDAISEKLI